MGHELTTLYGHDAASVVVDYLRTQGAADVVVERRSVSGLRRLLASFLPSFSERLIESLPSINVHVVAGDPQGPSSRAPLWSRVAPSGVNWKGLVFAVVTVLLTALLLRGLYRLGAAETVAYPLLLTAAVAAAFVTRSYLPAVVASLLAAASLDYLGLRPFDLRPSTTVRASMRSSCSPSSRSPLRWPVPVWGALPCGPPGGSGARRPCST